MKTIQIKLEAHVFAEEKLFDESLNDPERFGFVGREIMEPLSRCRNHVFPFYYNDSTTVGDVILEAKRQIWGTEEPSPGRTIYSFLSNGERYYIVNEQAPIDKLIHLYLDPQDTGTITVCALISCDAGAVDGVHPLRFSIHSRESGKHHEPHVHVRDSGYQFEASVRISDGEIIAGHLPSKYAKLAKKQILSEQRYYYECWNTMTDGLIVDINHHFGIIGY